LGWLTARTELFFPLLLIVLMLVVEFGWWLRQRSSDTDAERQSLVDSARDGLIVLLGLLLGFSLPMVLPHYEQRAQLVIDEATKIAAAEQLGQMLPDPFRGKILQLLREYLDARIEFVSAGADESKILSTIDLAKNLQYEMWQQSIILVQQKPNVVTPLFTQTLAGLAGVAEESLAAEEKRVPQPIWMVLVVISVMTCFVVGYSMRRRMLLAMLVLPLTVAIVLSLVAELDNPRTGFVRMDLQSLQRLQLDLKADVPPNPAP